MNIKHPNSEIRPNFTFRARDPGEVFSLTYDGALMMKIFPHENCIKKANAVYISTGALTQISEKQLIIVWDHELVLKR